MIYDASADGDTCEFDDTMFEDGEAVAALPIQVDCFDGEFVTTGQFPPGSKFKLQLFKLYINIT